MSTRSRIVLARDESEVVRSLLKSVRGKKVSKVASTENRGVSRLKESDIVVPLVVRAKSTGKYFYKNDGSEFSVQGPFDSYKAAVRAAAEELEQGPKKTATSEFPEFDAEYKVIGDGENKKGPEDPEIHTTEMSEFGGPKEVVDQHRQSATKRKGAETDDFPGPDGENKQGPETPELHTPEQYREFPGPDGVNKQGPETPDIHTTEMSEFGGPQEMK